MIRKIIWPFLLVVITALSITTGILFWQQPRIVYADLQKVYAGFEMTKELEVKLKQTTDMRQKQLDSLELNLNIMSRTLQNFERQGNKKGIDERMPEFEMRKQEYFGSKSRFDEDNEALTQQYTAQIWKQINQYVNDFGTAEGYSYILGADGSGAVMFSGENNDATAQITAYINQRYKGKGDAK